MTSLEEVILSLKTLELRDKQNYMKVLISNLSWIGHSLRFYRRQQYSACISVRLQSSTKSLKAYKYWNKI